MIRKLFFLLVILPLTLVLLAFIVANRHQVLISFDPFNVAEPAFALTMPAFILMFGFLLIGVVLGGVATWFSQGHFRKEAREQRFAAAKAARDAEDLKQSLKAAQSEAGLNAGALPSPAARA
jgi:uncharacterized membrane protein (DUF485 family)